MSCVRTSLIALPAFALPAVAHAAGRLTPAGVFADAAPLQKLIIIILILAPLAAIAAAATRRGGEFVSSLRLGGPLLGLLGATYAALNCAIGAANIHPTDPNVFAPGVAESLLVLGLGTLAGITGVVAHGVAQGRA